MPAAALRRSSVSASPSTLGKGLRALLLIVLAACAGKLGAPDDSEPPVDLSLSLTLVGAGAEAAEPLAVDLRLAFPGDADGETELELAGEWGGVGPDRPGLEDLRVQAMDGTVLAPEPAGPHRWRVAHEPDAWLVVRARLPRNAEPLRAAGDSRDHYRPILEPGLLHAIGHLFLPVPDHLDWARPRTLRIEYAGFDEAGWDVVDSFGVGAGPRRVEATLGELRAALFVGGDLWIERPGSCEGLVVALARTRSNGFVLPRADEDEPYEPGLDALGDLPELTGRLIAAERELMHDEEPSHYLVSAIPVGAPRDRGWSFGGTGLTNCFALFLQPNVGVDLEGRGGLQLHRLLAHECFHEWNGIGIPLGEDEELDYWFSEGFTNWAARETLRHEGFLDDAAYAEDLSRALREYHTSELRNASAAELAPAFWTDAAARDQPYLRGDVVAMWLDHALRDASDGADDLFAFLRDLHAEARADGTRFDADALLARIEARVAGFAGPERGRDVAAAVRRVVVHGDTALLPDDAFVGASGGTFEVVEVPVFAWDPGFDVDASLDAKRAIGVRAGGPAALAGLVEGAEVPGFSIWRGDADREIELTVLEDGAPRTLRFLPRAETETTVPAVRLRSE